jgi:hypothetical protein
MAWRKNFFVFINKVDRRGIGYFLRSLGKAFGQSPLAKSFGTT